MYQDLEGRSDWRGSFPRDMEKNDRFIAIRKDISPLTIIVFRISQSGILKIFLPLVDKRLIVMESTATLLSIRG
jgi:hypothetical protein